jgi:thioredoxin-related protein
MKNIVLILSLYLGNYAYCQEPGIEFKTGTWEDVRLLAKASDKPVFIFAYSPGCHFCRKMETAVFPDKTVAAYYNATFINYQLNLEEGEGLDLAKKYDINRFPTYVYFDKSGNLLHGGPDRSQQLRLYALAGQVIT